MGGVRGNNADGIHVDAVVADACALHLKERIVRCCEVAGSHGHRLLRVEVEPQRREAERLLQFRDGVTDELAEGLPGDGLAREVGIPDQPFDCHVRGVGNGKCDFGLVGRLEQLLQRVGVIRHQLNLCIALENASQVLRQGHIVVPASDPLHRHARQHGNLRFLGPLRLLAVVLRHADFNHSDVGPRAAQVVEEHLLCPWPLFERAHRRRRRNPVDQASHRHSGAFRSERDRPPLLLRVVAGYGDEGQNGRLAFSRLHRLGAPQFRHDDIPNVAEKVPRHLLNRDHFVLRDVEVQLPFSVRSEFVRRVVCIEAHATASKHLLQLLPCQGRHSLRFGRTHWRAHKMCRLVKRFAGVFHQVCCGLLVKEPRFPVQVDCIYELPAACVVEQDIWLVSPEADGDLDVLLAPIDSDGGVMAAGEADCPCQEQQRSDTHFNERAAAPSLGNVALSHF
ncbi:acyl-CoA dehydrogenase [Babesia caballi]|uniref:Acyl-CoA dehydrogenase n=1 Tax=Babesia caballi TaxID=5871 RepID=A0AAV4LWH4_BABCB|nr:acyl-CoA dehydrogenase [Babesia caballi]